MGIGFQIAMTGLVIAALSILFYDHTPKWVKMIGGIAFWCVPVGIIIQIWS